jgi:drug/metabolite transporter (DMT)-like permease
MRLRTNDITIWLVLALLGLVFGSAFLFVKVLVGALTPMQVVAWRLTLATLVVFVALAARRDVPTPSRALLLGGLALAFLDCLVPYVLIAWAAQDMQSGTTAALMSTMPMFTSIFAYLTPAEERLSPARISGLLTGFLGVAILVGHQALDPRSGVGVPHAAVILAAASYAGATVYARALSRTQNVVDLTAAKLGLATIAAVLLSTAVDGPVTAVSLSTPEVGALLALGIVSTGLGRLTYLWVIAEAGSVRASLVTYIIPVAALLLGWLLLDEAISASTFGGTALIILGVASVIAADRISLIVKRLRIAPVTWAGTSARVSG